MYLYINRESQAYPWSVGHYDPITFYFIVEGDYRTQTEAVERVNKLNGGK